MKNFPTENSEAPPFRRASAEEKFESSTTRAGRIWNLEKSWFVRPPIRRGHRFSQFSPVSFSKWAEFCNTVRSSPENTEFRRLLVFEMPKKFFTTDNSSKSTVQLESLEFFLNTKTFSFSFNKTYRLNETLTRLGRIRTASRPHRFSSIFLIISTVLPIKCTASNRFCTESIYAFDENYNDINRQCSINLWRKSWLK